MDIFRTFAYRDAICDLQGTSELVSKFLRSHARSANAKRHKSQACEPHGRRDLFETFFLLPFASHLLFVLVVAAAVAVVALIVFLWPFDGTVRLCIWLGFSWVYLFLLVRCLFSP